MSTYIKQAIKDSDDIIKRLIVCFIIGSLIYVFQKPIFNALNDAIVKHLFKGFIADSFTDFITILLFLAALIIFTYNVFYKGLYPSPNSILVMLTAIIIYFVVFRFKTQFQFLKIFDNYPIAYFDIVIISVPVFFLRYTAYKILVNDENADYFFEDNYNEKSDNDLYGRENIAGNIADLISNTITEEAFSIAIIGNWGAGKSVYLKFLQKRLEAHNEIVHFNPWKVKDVSQVYDSFFSVLAKSIKKYNQNASNQLKEYADYISEIEDDNIVLKATKTISKITTKSEDVFTKFDSINKLISLTGKRFIVFIDDLDRLTGKEIVQILKLIRNAANFQNVFFITAIDYSYAIETMKGTSELAFEEVYLQKIFQYEFVLPPIKKSFILKTLDNKLGIPEMEIGERTQFQLAFNELFFDQKDVVVGMYPGITFQGTMEKAIDNMRDLIRFLNSFKISYSLLKDEVELRDLILLELIKLRSIKAYLLVSQKKLITVSEQSSKNNFVFDEKGFTKYFGDDPHSDLIKLLINDLFSTPKQLNRSIVFPINFDIYFHYQLFQNISLVEFNKARSGPIIPFYNKIIEWINEGKGNSIEALLGSISIFFDFDEFEKYITLYLLLGTNWLGVAFSFFTNVKKIRDSYHVSDEDITNLLSKLLRDNTIPYYSRSEFASFFYNEIVRGHNAIIGSREFWLEIQLEIFSNFVHTSKGKFETISYEIYFNIPDYIGSHGELIIHKEANAIMMRYLDSVKASYGPYLWRYIERSDNITFTFDPWLQQIFSNLKIVKDFVMSISSEDDLVKYAKQFWPKYENAVYNGGSEFIIENEILAKQIVELVNKTDKALIGR